jgi:predicted nucleic acid-binding protein
MNIVLDTSVVIALIVSDEERKSVVDVIDGYDFVCPESIHPEIGNAVSAMFKKGRISLDEGIEITEGFQKIKIQTVSLNLKRAVEISHNFNIYAYDAYVIECAERLKSALVTLDSRMKDVAKKLGISIIEV